ALSWAIWMLSSGAPSIRLNAFRTPLSSTIAMSIGTSISAAFASAASIARRAASVLMLAFENVLAMGLLCRGGNRSARLPPRARPHARRVRAALGSAGGDVVVDLHCHHPMHLLAKAPRDVVRGMARVRGRPRRLE